VSGEIYTPTFYDRAERSSAAAAAIVGLIHGLLPVTSVLDVGCARGTWLAAWRQAGCEDALGIDGSHVDRTKLLIPPERFIQADLGQPFSLERRFDLVQCLEVAEHLPAARGGGLVDDLTAHGDVVMFSAAPPGQGGAGHINEQPYDVWRDLFAARGYSAFDCIRPAMAGRRDLPYWYRYNLLLYVRIRPDGPELPGRLAAGTSVPDISPPLFKLRKALFQRMPTPFLDRLADINARLKH
jgi:SAM-dependent methyltransferase